MAEDYDRLSPLGEHQSKKLGEFWVQHRIEFDICYCGPAKRHRGTLDIAAEVVRGAGMKWPQVETLSDLDEFDAFRMMQLLTPILVDSDSEVRKLNETFRAEPNSPEAGYRLQKLFEAVARRWCSGEYDNGEFETWSQFRNRVAAAISRVRQEAGRGRNILVITSGGPIAATVSTILDLPPLASIELLWMSRNASFTELLYNDQRVTMHSFNSIPHLDSRDLLTYR